MTSSPNILWIVLDAQRADRLGCYGYDRPTSPNIDRLASEGLRAEVCISQGGYSLPSYATMFTGLYPSEHGAIEAMDRLPETVPSLPETLAQNGYRTASIGSNPFIHEVFGMARGFDVLHYCNPAMVVGLTQKGKPKVSQSRLREKLWRYLGLSDQGGRQANARTLQFINGCSSEPWFCFLHYMETHEPYAPPLASRFAWRRSWLDPVLNPLTVVRINQARYLMNAGPSAIKAYLALYDAEVAYQDGLVGSLLDTLRRQGLLQNTITIICADHGDFLGERGMFRHAAGLGEGLCRVPLIVHGAGYVQPGTVLEGIAELRDIPHSLCRLLGRPEPDAGQRPAHNLFGSTSIAPGRLAFAERRRLDERMITPRTEPSFGPGRRFNRSVCLLRDEEWEYLEYEDGGAELYRVAVDPSETKDLGATEPARASYYKERLAEVRKGLSQSSEGQIVDTLTDEVEARLRDLGYM